MSISRRALLAAGSAAAASGAAACLPGTFPGRAAVAPEVKFGEPVSVTFWHTETGANERALSDAVSRFNLQTGKNILLRSEFQGNAQQVFQKTIVALQAGSPPDAAVAYESMVQEYARAGAVLDLDAYLTSGASPLSREGVADLFPSFLDSGRLDAYSRRLLAFPFARSLAVQYYNEDLLAAAGSSGAGRLTVDAFRRQAAAVTKKDAAGRTTVYGQHIRVDASYIDAFILANGGELLSRDLSRVRFNEPPGLEVFETWDAMIKGGQAYSTRSFDYQVDFGMGRVAALHDTSASRPFIATEVMDKSAGKERFRWGIGMLPQKDPARPLTATFGASVVAFKSTPLRQAATWEWLRFFAEREETAGWSIATGYLPVRRSAAEHAGLKAQWQQSPQAEQAFRMAEFARPEPNIAAWQGVRDLLQGALAAVIAQRSAPKAALDDAARRANQLIQEKK